MIILLNIDLTKTQNFCLKTLLFCKEVWDW